MSTTTLAPATVQLARTKQVNPRRQVNERWRVETRRLFAHIRTIDFVSLMRPLRPDFAGDLTVDVPTGVRESMRGGCNVHLPVRWSDGRTWLIRIKLHCVVAFGMIAPEVRRLTLESERETMVALRAMGLAVPEVYSPVVVTNDIEYIVVECLSGSPCSRPIATDQLDKVIPHLAAFLVKLSQTTFSAIGSLYPSTLSGGVSVVGPSVSLKFLRPEAPHFLGPHTTSGARYLAQIQHVLDKIQRGDRSLGHPAVVYLVHLWLGNLVRSCARLWVEEEIMLRHADDQGDHLFLNEQDDGLSGLIDWEWAVTASKSEAFAAPAGLLDPVAFQNGSNELSRGEIMLVTAFEDMARPDLADCVRRGKLHHRLRDAIGSKPAIGMLLGLASAANISGGRDEEGLAGWCAGMMAGEDASYRSDAVLQALLGDDGLSS